MEQTGRKLATANKAPAAGRVPRKIIAFHLVAARGERKLIEEFVHLEKLPVDSRDSNWNTALMKAAEKGNEGGVGKLLMLGADPNAANKDGLTALMRAAENGHSGSVRILLAYRANAYLKDGNGKKAADHARENGYPRTAGIIETHQNRLNQSARESIAKGKKGEAKYYICEGADPSALGEFGAQFLNLTSD